MIEVPFHRPIGIVNHLAVFGPGQPADLRRVVHPVQQIEEQLLPIAPTDKIHFRTLIYPLGHILASHHLFTQFHKNTFLITILDSIILVLE